MKRKKKKLPELPSKDYEAIPVAELIILLLLVYRKVSPCRVLNLKLNRFYFIATIYTRFEYTCHKFLFCSDFVILCYLIVGTHDSWSVEMIQKNRSSV